MSHTITVTKIEDDESDDYEWELGGTCENYCLAWWECMKDSHRHPKNDDLVGEDWSTKRVREWHKWIDGVWMIQRGCGYNEADLGSVEWDLRGAGAAVGDVFDIDIEWDGDDWIVTALPQPVFF